MSTDPAKFEKDEKELGKEELEQAAGGRGRADYQGTPTRFGDDMIGGPERPRRQQENPFEDGDVSGGDLSPSS